MIEAALRGKLSCLNAEDALTSVVFGSLRYLDSSVLWEWLQHATNVQGEKLGGPSFAAAKIVFWPGYADTFRKVGTVEPDVVIDDGVQSVVIEAKLWSGKSPSLTETTEGNYAPADQLAREWHAAFHAPKERGLRSPRALIYLTKHLSLPREELQASLNALKERGIPNAPLFWLSWNALELPLSRVLEELSPARIIASDVLEYLRAAELLRFGGWRLEPGDFGAPDRLAWTYRSRCFYFESLNAVRQSWVYGGG